jgi:hypothetical protein
LNFAKPRRKNALVRGDMLNPSGHPVRRWQAVLLVVGALLLIPPIEVAQIGFSSASRLSKRSTADAAKLIARTRAFPLHTACAG